MDGNGFDRGSDWVAACRVVRCLCREHLSPGFVDLMRHASVWVYVRPHELRLIEVLLDSSGPALFAKKAPKKLNTL